MYYECQTCSRDFTSEHASRQHMNALDHWAPTYECQTCSRDFTSEHASRQHMNALDHWASTYECESCDDRFSSQDACEQHMNYAGHWEHYCSPCNRRFQNANALKMHLNSRTHRGTNVNCPFCRRDFTTASGVSHHLETGSCPNARNLNRDTIFQAIRQRDRNGVFTNNLLEWHQGTTGTWSSENAWNGNGFECYLCHRQFGAMSSLDKHLKSPVHLQEVYHCPNQRQCGTQFKTLAALFNHLESEKCSFIKFEGVQKNVGNILTGKQRLIGFG